MITNDDIKHQGKIERIEKNKVFVRIEQNAACQGCHAVTVCLASDKKEKIIAVDDCSGSFALREEVVVSVRLSLGLFAVLIAYILPLLFVIIATVIVRYASGSEALGGLIGLSVLIPYYFLLYLFRGKLKKRFVFSLSKIPD